MWKYIYGVMNEKKKFNLGVSSPIHYLSVSEWVNDSFRFWR